MLTKQMQKNSNKSFQKILIRVRIGLFNNSKIAIIIPI